MPNLPIPREELLSDSHLAQFLKELIKEEARLGRSVPGPDCNILLSNLTLGGSSPRSLRRLMNMLVQDGFLKEDRTGTRINLNGYFVETKGAIHVQQWVPGRIVEPYDPNLPIGVISRMKKTDLPCMPAKPAVQDESVSQTQPTDQKLAVTVARQRVTAAENSLQVLVATFERKQKALSAKEHRIAADIPGLHTCESVLKQLRMEVRILSVRVPEAEFLLKRAMSNLKSVLSEKEN